MGKIYIAFVIFMIIVWYLIIYQTDELRKSLLINLTVNDKQIEELNPYSAFSTITEEELEYERQKFHNEMKKYDKLIFNK